MISQYNCFLLNGKSDITDIIIFFPFIDDDTIIMYNSHDKYKKQDFIKKYFTNYEMNNIIKNEVSPNIVYSNFPITVTDKVETLQYAILKALNINNELLLEELYLYAMSFMNETPELIFSKMTDNEYLNKSSLMKFLSNIELNKNKSKLKSTKHELYNFNDFKNLNIFKDIKREKVPLTIMNDDIQYINPYKAIEVINEKVNNTDNNDLFQSKNNSTYVTHRSIQEFLQLDSNSPVSIYGCFMEFLLTKPRKENNINILNHYFPSMINITSKEQLISYRDEMINNDSVTNKKQVISSLLESKTILTKHLQLSLKKWENEFQKQTIIKNMRVELKPKKKMFISLDTLFHVLELNKETILIKYNPGARLEKYYRIYLPNTNMRKTFIQKINNELSKAKKRSVSCLLNVKVHSKLVPVIIEIRENGYLYVSLQNNTILEDKSYEETTLYLSDIEDILKNTYNKFIDNINEYYHQYESLLPKFESLHQLNLQVISVTAIKKHKIKENKFIFDNLNKYSSYVKNIFENIDMKQNDYIKFLFKYQQNTGDTINILFQRTVLKDKSFETIIENFNNFDLLAPIMLMFDNLLYIAQENIELSERTLVINNENENNGLIFRNDESILSEKNELEMITNQIQNMDNESDIINKETNMMKENKNSKNIAVNNSELMIQFENKVNEKKNLLGLKKKINSNDNNNFFGGAKATVIDEKRNYTYDRIKQYDPELVKKEKELKRDYSRYCMSSERRQPTIITENEKREIDELAPGSYGNEEAHALRYRKKDGENLYYICPRYWCIDKNIALRHEDVVKSGDSFTSSKCPTGKIISYDHSLYHYRKGDKTKYVNTYPGLNLKKSNIPCCFKNPRKDIPPVNNNENRNNKIVTNENVVNLEKEDINIEASKNIRILEYNKFPLPEFRYGFLPLNIKLMLGIKTNDCIDDRSNCLLRFGSVNNEKNSFLHVMYTYYIFKKSQTRITQQLKNLMKNIDEFINEITNNWLSIDEFLNYQNGHLIELFDYDRNDNNGNTFDENILKDSIVLTTITDNNGNIDESMKYKILRSFYNYKHFLSNDNIDYKYTWELFTNKLNQVDKTKTNIIIIEIDGFEVESPCRIICPYGYKKNETFNYRKPSVILLKYGNYYEAIIQRSRFGESKYYNKVFFNESDDILKPFLSKIENIYNNNDFCGKYMTNKLFLNDYKNFTEVNPNKMQLFFDENGFTIKRYIVNYNTKLCGFIVSHESYNKDIFIPVHQTGIEELRNNVKSNRKYDLLNTVSEYLNLVDSLRVFNMIHDLKNEFSYKPQYFVCEDDYVLGIQLENTLVVPILPHIPKSTIPDDIMLDCVKNNYIYTDKNEIKYYDALINKINNKTESKIENKTNNLLNNISETSVSYSIYRSHIKSNMNLVENRNLKNQIQSLLINTNDDNYSATIEKLIELINKLALINKNKLALENNDNMDLYAYLLSDELLRYYRIRDYIFIDNKYILFGEKYSLSKENELLVTQGSLETLNEELIDKSINKSNHSIYSTSNPENLVPLKYDDGFDILQYVPSDPKLPLFQTLKQVDNNTSNKEKNKTKKKREKCPNGTRRNKTSGLCEIK